jgi:multiple sugar transport system ATP-binding protein
VATVSFQNVNKHYPGYHAVRDLNLEIADGEFVVLVGPSGCGKSTTLRMLAGLEEITSGEIRIGDRRVNEIEPGNRDIAMVFQNYALYPHMTVRQNLAFGLKMRRTPKPEIERRVAEAAETLGITTMLNRRPRELSGGQRQRVALGRAIVRHPQVFLFDEPLSNLDAKLRVQMRAELLSLHQRIGITTIYVTHDQTEAMTLGDRVVVMRHGVVQQVDAPERLYRKPANMFVAGFIGSPAMNFVEGTLSNGSVVLGEHTVPLPTPGGRSGPVVVGIRPEDVVVGDSGLLPAQIEITEQLGPEMLVHIDVPGVTLAAGEGEERRTRLVSRAPGTYKGTRGDLVRVTFNTDHLQLFDPESGEALL